MKTITVKDIVIEEMIIRPGDAHPVSVSYKLFDENNELITTRRQNLSAGDVTSEIVSLTTKLLGSIEDGEDILKEGGGDGIK